MVTRKAIATAFEVIVGDSQLHSVTVFCATKGMLIGTIQRVRVTRRKGLLPSNSYNVTLGKLNYAERQYVKKCRARKNEPKVMLSYCSNKGK